MDGMFWFIAAVTIAGMTWFTVWIWQQRGPGMVERRLGDRPIDEMPIRLPPD